MLSICVITYKNKQKESKVYLDMKKTGCFIVIDVLYNSQQIQALMVKIGLCLPRCY